MASARSQARPVYLVDGARTPFIKARGKPGPFSPADLAVQCGRPLLMRQPFAADSFDQVVLGCGNQLAGEMNVARVAALRLGCGVRTPAWTVHRNCGSGMQAIDDAFRNIAHGDMDLVLAGGTESLSRAPLIVADDATEWLARLRSAKGAAARAAAFAQFELSFLSPEIALKQGLTDPVSGLTMGQTAEVLAHRFGISREEADAYAMESHHRLANAQKQGWLDDEIEPMFAPDGTLYDHDDGVRPESTPESLAKLRPVFEKYGDVTAGNASQVTDGACLTILASEAAVERHGLTPIARIVDSEWAALDPEVMGLGPVFASSQLMERAGLSLDDIDLWELNEAFAAQVLACLSALADDGFCREVLGRDGAVGRIDRDRLNVDGGAISLGHPVGTSGARIVLHLVNVLRRAGGKRGIATLCIGGGQGGAMLVEAL
ncbi:acetyl-CoA C-acetyltransferase [Novosphingobium marinum]|uniref:Acetyl-CoA C-acetyltransferase n=1 Tax=Novosphingobium marinum TaxID=1514948 RepID=A0A7Y9XXQ7_9SPHN|nr:acetyl-CoA C-acetyltransferase [Novosphingobium marinum]